MKTKLFILTIATSALLSVNVSATVHYVDVNCTNPVYPYTNWATAATNIQSAISSASYADLVLVTNGIYRTGGRTWADACSNRVVLYNAVTVRSVNGPGVTAIQGYPAGATNSPKAVRCVYMENGAVLSGFTLTNGAVCNGWWGGSYYSGVGAGVCCQSTNCLVTNCIITGNFAGNSGGGANSGTLVNCVFAGNFASGWGGGAYYSTLVNCVLTRNVSAYVSGAAAYCDLINCTVANNTAGSYGGGTIGGSLKNCILYHNSPDNYSDYAFCTNCCVTPLPLVGNNNFTNAPQLVNLQAGDLRLQPWSPCVNAGNNAFITSSTDLDGNPRIFGGTVDVGAYENSYTGTVHYVRWQSTNAISPYSSWNTAATNIQDAVGAAQCGEFVIVGNGTYSKGGAVVSGETMNRVALTNAITVLSLNGPQATTIWGLPSPTRCAYVGSNAVLSGFTLTRGSTAIGSGAWCKTGGVVSNCLVTLCNAAIGGGIYGGTIYNSMLAGNSATDSGGGAYQATLHNCTLIQNTANNQGGGTFQGTLYNCVVYDNNAADGINHYGAEMYYCCTTPLPTNGVGNITNEPVLVVTSSSCRLQSNSPCINAGNNTYTTSSADLDGNPRIRGGTVDIGAYEYQSPVSILSYAWLQQYGLTNNGSADYADTDHDGINNWNEWMADTSPLDANDYLHITSFTREGTYNLLQWTSKTTRLYRVERRETLAGASPWETIITNAAPGWNNVGFDNTGPQYFYRIQVVRP
jgi:hypothetical protein